MCIRYNIYSSCHRYSWNNRLYPFVQISLYLSPLIVLFRSEYPNFAPRCNRISLGTLERSELSFFSDNSDANFALYSREQG